MRITTLLAAATLCTLSLHTTAQNIQHTLIDATPLILNPAFAGNIPGKGRITANHRFESNNSFSPYYNTNFSIDLPLLTLKNGDYIGGGLHSNRHHLDNKDFININQSISTSISVHKLIKTGKKEGQKNLLDIAIGISGGIASHFNDVSIDYFTYNGHNTLQPTIPTHFLYIPGSDYYNFGIGTSVSHSVGKKFNYTVGYSIKNINEPSDAVLKKQAYIEGLDKRHLLTVGGNIYLNQRWQLRPCFVHIKQTTTTNYIAGNEFMYHLKNSKKHTALFAGVWYRSGDMHMATAGINRSNLRAAIAVDYGISNPKRIYYNNAIELSLSYSMLPTKNSRKQMVCDRF